MCFLAFLSAEILEEEHLVQGVCTFSILINIAGLPPRETVLTLLLANHSASRSQLECHLLRETCLVTFTPRQYGMPFLSSKGRILPPKHSDVLEFWYSSHYLSICYIICFHHWTLSSLFLLLYFFVPGFKSNTCSLYIIPASWNYLTLGKCLFWTVTLCHPVHPSLMTTSSMDHKKHIHTSLSPTDLRSWREGLMSFCFSISISFFKR